MLSSNFSLSVFQNIYDKFEEIMTLQETTDSNSRFQDDINQMWIIKLQHKLKLYVSPILLITGLIGNILSIIILRHSKKRSSINTYLSVLALADISVLIFGLLSTWVHEVSGVDVFRSRNALCKVWNWIAFSSSIFSVWLIVAITTERFIVVCFPLSAQRVCNKRRTKGIIIFILIFSLCLNAHFLFTTGIVNHESTRLCDALDGYKHFVRKIWSWMDAAVYFILPFLIISALNTVIVAKVVKATRRRRSLQQPKHDKSVGCDNRTRRDVKLNVMLLAVSITFCISSSPMVVLMVTEVLFDENAPPEKLAALFLARTICELLMYVNHAINFLLYCVSGGQFTETLIKLLICRTRYTPLSKNSTRRKSNIVITSKETCCWRHFRSFANKVWFKDEFFLSCWIFMPLLNEYNKSHMKVRATAS